MKHIHERDLLKRWEEVADLLPKFAKVDIGIDHIELILCYTLTRIKQGDIIEVEKLLKSKLNPKKRGNVMKSIAHHWMQQGKEEAREEAKAEAVKLVNIKMQEEKITMAKKMLKEGIPLDAVIKIIELSKADLER
ncbi:transposase [Rickettsia endosymbiont of Rhinocyllus conicus]|uniref:transposase n=1 Tax=Rickettsia endosymbiont of Rhinocyllus conicus TaxID=3066252 RepID=UPI003132E9D8